MCFLITAAKEGMFFVSDLWFVSRSVSGITQKIINFSEICERVLDRGKKVDHILG